MNALRDALVKRYDVVIVGGGVAGLAIAERLAREAVRQEKHLTILLVEQEGTLGAAASGGLEGWGHTGTLYSKERSSRFFANFLSAFEDLHNWYKFDPLFKFRDHCNLQNIEKAKRPAYDFPVSTRVDSDSSDGTLEEKPTPSWFLGPITYLLPDQPLSSEPSKDRFDVEEWRRILKRVRTLVSQAYFRKEWVNESFGCCQAPYVEEISTSDSGEAGEQAAQEVEIHSGGPVPPSDRLRLEDIMAAAATPEGVDGRLQHFEPLQSCDAALNTQQVLRDLTEAATLQGVEILCGYRMDPQSIQISPYGTVDRVTGILLTPSKPCVEGPLGESRDDPDAVHVIADQYIFAVGVGFDEGELLHNKLDVHVKVQNKLSVMLVTRPALCDFSFVRMDLHSRNDFNHIFRQSYSVIADSNALDVNAPAHLRVAAAHKLLQKAETYFGDRIRECEFVGWYTCVKTEFPETAEEERDYSYYWGPKWADWDEGKWETLRTADRRGAQELILEYVQRNKLGVPNSDGLLLFESSWALKKAIHFALQRMATAARVGCGLTGDRERQDSLKDARAVFCQLRDYAISEFEKRNRRQPARHPNFLCVIPGKFSLFPTLAHQVYIEMEVRGLYQQIVEKELTLPRPLTQDQLSVLVAAPRAEIVLSKLERWSAQMRNYPGLLTRVSPD